MSDPAIRAALEAAAKAHACADGHEPDAEDIQRAAAAVAAFLRALSDAALLRLLAADTNTEHGWRDTLAAALEEAAR